MTLLGLSLGDWNNLAQILNAFISVLALLVGGIWAYATFVRQREGHPRLEFTTHIGTFGKQHDSYVLEVVSNVTNKGLVRQWITQVECNVRYLLASEEPERGGEDILEQTKFPHATGSKGLIPLEWNGSFVEAGVTQRYSYVVHIPKDAGCVLVWAKIISTDRWGTFHTAQRLYRVEDNGSILASELH